MPLEDHPVFAQAMADYEPPPPKHPTDETKLDMNPLIDVALVLLIFFMLTTTYEELRKEFNPPGDSAEPEGEEDRQVHRTIAVRVTARMEDGEPVFRVEGEVVAEDKLKDRFKELIESSGRTDLAVEMDSQVAWKAFVKIRDAAAGQVPKDHPGLATAVGRGSGENLLHHPGRLDAGQPHVEALVLDREPVVVDAEQVQHRGVQVVDVDDVLDRVVAELVGRAVA